MNKVRWGIIGAAKIAVRKVIPALQKSKYSQVVAIASRDLDRAQTVARQLGLARAYGSYEALLADPDIDAVYIPLPNHLHVPWSIRALAAGKHVLCEKPIALSAAEAESLVEAAGRHPNLKVMEAFMYRHHPQWQKALALVQAGQIGALRTIQSFFSYYNVEPENVRNQTDIGGGGLMDIGCYSISLSRFLFESEPIRVCGLMEYDPVFQVDRLSSGMLQFAGGTATFTCATQLFYYQRVHILGTEGRIDLPIPFNAPPDAPSKIFLHHGSETQEIAFDICDQFQIQGDLFSRAILNNLSVPTPLTDAVANMKVIDAIRASAQTGTWIEN